MDTISYAHARTMLDAGQKLFAEIMAFRIQRSQKAVVQSPAARETDAFTDPEIIRTGLSQGYAHIDVAGDHLVAFTQNADGASSDIRAVGLREMRTRNRSPCCLVSRPGDRRS
jgi:hypothetical protein